MGEEPPFSVKFGLVHLDVLLQRQSIFCTTACLQLPFSYLLNTSFLKHFRSVSDVFFPHHCARLVPRAGAIQRRASCITVDVITKKFVLVFRAHLGSQGLDGRETVIGSRTYKSKK